MNKNSLLGLGASALMVVALTACGGTAASPEPAAVPASETATPTPTPVKQYTTQELVDLVKQVKSADGSSPAVVSGEELANQFDPLVEGLGKTAIEPAGCKDLSTLGVSLPIGGSTTAGTARTKTGGVAGLTLTSGVDLGLLQANVDKIKSQAETCRKMSFSAEGQSITVTTEKVEGIGSLPGTVAFKSVMAMPDGRAQSLYTAHAIKDGVLISASASEKNGETNGPAAAGALVDQAAALIK